MGRNSLTLVALAFLSFGVIAKGAEEKCVVEDLGGGDTVIACPDYIVNKSPKKTIICRLPQGSPNVYCTEVPK